MPNKKDNFVVCDAYNEGLTEEKANEAIKMLNRNKL